MCSFYFCIFYDHIWNKNSYSASSCPSNCRFIDDTKKVNSTMKLMGTEKKNHFEPVPTHHAAGLAVPSRPKLFTWWFTPQLSDSFPISPSWSTTNCNIGHYHWFLMAMTNFITARWLNDLQMTFYSNSFIWSQLQRCTKIWNSHLSSLRETLYFLRFVQFRLHWEFYEATVRNTILSIYWVECQTPVISLTDLVRNLKLCSFVS